MMLSLLLLLLQQLSSSIYKWKKIKSKSEETKLTSDLIIFIIGDIPLKSQLGSFKYFSLLNM